MESGDATIRSSPRDLTGSLAGESDEDLLLYMSWRKDDAETAREAFAELWRRHARYLHWVCHKAYADWFPSDGWVNDLVSDTFKRVFEHAGTFRRIQDTDPEARRRWLRAWLGKIARNVASDMLAESGGPGCEQLVGQEFLDDVAQVEGDRESIPSETVQAIKSLMQERLTDREREVVLERMQWYDPGRSQQRLPNNVAKEMAKRHNTTPENIRKIYQRALEKLEEGIQKALGASPFTREVHE
jgi:RNA polymerase sigma factor (sigma-70 family)